MRRILLGVFILLLVTVSVFGQDRGIYPQTGDKFIYKVKEHDVERTIEISIVKPGAISRVNLGGTEGDLIAFTSFTRTGSFPAIEREKLEKAK